MRNHSCSVAKRSAVQLWRKGVPLRLRGFVWRKAIGNHLQLSKQQFHDFVVKYDESALEGAVTATAPSQPEVSVTTYEAEDYLPESKVPAPQQHLASSECKIVIADEIPELASLRGSVWGSAPSSDFFLSSSSAHAPAAVAASASSQPHPDVPTEIVVAPEIPDFLAARTTSFGDVPPPIFFEDTAPNITIPVSGARQEYVHTTEERPTAKPNGTRHVRSKSRTYQVTRTRSLLPGLSSQIKLDLSRTFSKLKLYSDPQLSREVLLVLEAVAFLRPQTGYVQGMTYLAGTLLLYMDAADATIALANLLDSSYLSALFTFNLPEMHRHSELFDQIFEHNLPQLHAHFKRLDICDEHYLIDWHLTLFTKAFPIPLASRLWDCVVLEGPLFIHLATLGILKVCLGGRASPSSHAAFSRSDGPNDIIAAQF